MVIWFKVRYAYDKVDIDNYKGIIKINNTLAVWKNSRWEITYKSSDVKKINFLVTEVKDFTYNLTTVDNLVGKVEVIWDRITIADKSLDKRINVGENVKIFFKLKSEYDNEIVKEGEVYIDNIKANFDYKNNTWYIFASSDTVTKKDFGITKVNWKKFNITAINPYSLENKTSVIWDSIRVVNYYSDFSRVEKGREIKIYVGLVYSYDNETLGINDIVYINETRANFDENSKLFYITFKSDEVNKYLFKVSKVISTKNITLIEDKVGGISVIFDEIIIEQYLNYNENLKQYQILVRLVYYYDKSIVNNAEVYINETKANYLGNGFYGLYYEKLSSNVNVDVKIKVEGFKEIIKNVTLHLTTEIPKITETTTQTYTTQTLTNNTMTGIITTGITSTELYKTYPSETERSTNLQLYLVYIIAIIVLIALISYFYFKKR